ncbi:T6SS amidase immunity protein Tai4 family protein [uncultured Serratia sp.]|uniref:T6SS amidase immunity protein Tai4 family protein n=1 Tax=Serratia marcescens TaxID=615 RepID=UPI00258CB731|nr:T6SS amidase immunity protein Tai4 family protein [uncultured Serratia sp.]
MSLLLGSHVVLAENSLNALSQEALYKNWLVSRCLGKFTDSENTRKDAFRSASAYLEFSKLPLSAFEEGEKLVESYLTQERQAATTDSYHTLECLALSQSKDAHKTFIKNKSNSRSESKQ